MKTKTLSRARRILSPAARLAVWAVCLGAIVPLHAGQIMTSLPFIRINEEGPPQYFSVWLDPWVAGYSRVDVGLRGNGVSVSLNTLYFHASGQQNAQRVSIAPIHDNDWDDSPCSIELWVSGWLPTNQPPPSYPQKVISGTVSDPDNGILVTPTSVTAVEPRDPRQTAACYVRLAKPPPPNLIVNVQVTISGDPDIYLNLPWPACLQFNSSTYDDPLELPIFSRPDEDMEDGSATIVLSCYPDPAPRIHLPASVSVVESDDDKYIVGDPAGTSLGMVEGGQAQVRVKLSTAPSGLLTVTCEAGLGLELVSASELTFGPGNWNNYQTVTFNSLHDLDPYDATTSLSAGAKGWRSQVFTILVDDRDARILADTNAVVVSEGLYNSFRVKLGGQPSNPLTVRVQRTDGDPDLAPRGTGMLIFTPDNWNVYQEVQLAAARDADTTDGTATITCSADAGWQAAVLTATERDDRGKRILTSLGGVKVPEGGTVRFGVRLNQYPGKLGATVAITRFAGDADLRVQAGASLHFTDSDWNTDKLVALTNVPDADWAGGEAIFRCTASGWGGTDVLATEQDDDLPPIVVSRTAVSVPEGGRGSFAIKLPEAPAGNVIVSVFRHSGDTDLTVASGATINFNSGYWDLWHPVTLRAAPDADSVNGTAIFHCSAAGYATAQVTATEEELALLLSTNALTVTEGAQATFQVRLNRNPGTGLKVGVARASGDADLSVRSPDAAHPLVFDSSNWNVPQTVILEAAQDVDVICGEALIECSSTDLSSKTLVATELDNDTLAIVANTNRVIVPEADAASCLLRLSHLPPTNVVVTVTRAAGDPDLTVAREGNLVFTPANWNINQPVTLAAAADADAAAGQATFHASAAGLAHCAVTAVELDDDVLALVVSARVRTVPEGGTAAFDVRLSAQPESNIVVSVVRQGGDPDVTVAGGSSLVFTPANWLTYQAVQLAASHDADALGGTATIRCSHPALGYRDVIAVESDDDLPFPVTVAVESDVLRLRWTTVPGGSYEVLWSSNLTTWHSVPLGSASEWADPNWRQASRCFYWVRKP